MCNVQCVWCECVRMSMCEHMHNDVHVTRSMHYVIHIGVRDVQGVICVVCKVMCNVQCAMCNVYGVSV